MDRSWKAFGERWIVSFARNSSRRDSSRVKSPKWVGMANSSEGSHSKAPSLPEECSLSASQNRSARGSPELPQSLSILRSRLSRSRGHLCAWEAFMRTRKSILGSVLMTVALGVFQTKSSGQVVTQRDGQA